MSLSWHEGRRSLGRSWKTPGAAAADGSPQVKVEILPAMMPLERAICRTTMPLERATLTAAPLEWASRKAETLRDRKDKRYFLSTMPLERATLARYEHSLSHAYAEAERAGDLLRSHAHQLLGFRE